MTLADQLYSSPRRRTVSLLMSLADTPSTTRGPGPSGFSPLGGGMAEAGPKASGSIQALARKMSAAKFGDEHWGALYQLVKHESGWRPGAKNPTSSARGLFQKMTSVHGPLERSAEGQIAWGLKYIAGRYGNPSKAWRFWRKRHFY